MGSDEDTGANTLSTGGLSSSRQARHHGDRVARNPVQRAALPTVDGNVPLELVHKERGACCKGHLDDVGTALLHGEEEGDGVILLEVARGEVAHERDAPNGLALGERGRQVLLARNHPCREFLREAGREGLGEKLVLATTLDVVGFNQKLPDGKFLKVGIS